jgi:D-alanine-D-alanine ligase-like ATP-grasp enzyme
MLRVTVLTGRSTPERDVALAGTAEVIQALRRRGYQVSVVDLAAGPLSLTAEADLLRPTVARLPPTLTHLAVLRARENWLQLVREPAICQADLLFPVFHGQELTVGVLGDHALAVGEIIPQHEIFDYECKYTPGMSQEVFPAELSRDLTEHIRTIALRVHRLLKLRHFSRIDFRLGEDGVYYCLEANTLPGLTRTSLVPQSAAAMGMPFEEFCDRLCRPRAGGLTKAYKRRWAASARASLPPPTAPDTWRWVLKI